MKGEFKIKRFLYYLGYTIVIGLILYVGVKYQDHLIEEAAMTYMMIPLVIYSSILPIIIGVLLRLPRLITEVKDRKRWAFDWIKVVTIGLPALYITSLPILSYTTSFGVNLLFANEMIYLNTSMIISTTGIIFGYILIDSLKE